MVPQRASLRAFLPVLCALAATACGEETPREDAPAGAEDVAGSPWAAEAPDTTWRLVREIGDGVYTYEYARPGDPVTTVSMWVVTDEGVLVADGQGDVAESERLLEEIRRTTDRPVTHLVVCSDHGDHTGGNAAFPESVEILAHPAAQAALQTRVAEEGGDVPLADRLVADARTIELGGRRIDVRFLGRGHTAGDLVVHLPDEDILFMSEAFLDRVFPLMITGYPSEWVETLRKAEAIGAETYVAGHGVRGSVRYGPAQLVAYRDAVEQVIAEVRRLHAAGLTVDDAVEQASFGALAQQADYVYQMERAVRRVWAEIEGELPPA